MQCGQSVQLLNVKLLVHHVTSRLYKVKYVPTLKTILRHVSIKIYHPHLVHVPRLNHLLVLALAYLLFTMYFNF